MADHDGVDALVVTALKEERDVWVRFCTDDEFPWEEYKDPEGFPYDSRLVVSDDGSSFRLAVAFSAAMGEAEAATAATRLLGYLRPSVLCMTGICAGDPSEVKLGDVVVAERLFKYDAGKLKAYLDGEDGRHEEISQDIRTYNLKPQWKSAVRHLVDCWKPRLSSQRPVPYETQERWTLEAVRDYGRDAAKLPERSQRCPDWTSVVQRLRRRKLLKARGLSLTKKGEANLEEAGVLQPDGPRPDASLPKVHVGTMATGGRVRQDPELFKAFESTVRKTIAVDMEAAAIGTVAEQFEGVEMLVAKGVCDYGDHEKDDRYHVYAAEASARFALAFLRTKEAWIRLSDKPSAISAAIWSVPYERNLTFTGRDEALSALREVLASSGGAAVTGLGGVGKTQLALEYAYRHGASYTVVWWVRSEDPATVTTDLAMLATKLGVVSADGTRPDRAAEMARDWLAGNDGWLLICDNAQSATTLRRHLPHPYRGHVLITSRDPAWRGFVRTVEVAPLRRKESVELLLVRSGRTDPVDAEEVASALGDLPLALVHAAAYVEESGCPFAEYLDMLQEHRAEVLQHLPRSGAYPDSVAATLSASIESVESASQGAAALLAVCAFLDPDNISLGLLRAYGTQLPSPLDNFLSDAFLCNETVRELTRYSLMYRKGNVLSLHRLVQDVTRDRFCVSGDRCYALSVMRFLRAAFPFDWNDPATWSPCEQALPHVLAATARPECKAAAPDIAATLLYDAGRYLYRLGLIDESQVAHESTLRLLQESSGLAISLPKPEGKDETSAREYASVARRHPDRVLQISREKFVGDKRFAVGASLNELARCHYARSDLAYAKRLLEYSLEFFLAALGSEEDRLIALTYHALGGVLRDRGELEAAKEYLLRAYAIDCKVLGTEQHLDVAATLHELATVLHSLGDLNDARQALGRSLEIGRRCSGEGDHPSIAASLDELAVILKAQGDVVEAERSLEHALLIDRAIYGCRLHYASAITQARLATLLFERGERNRSCDLLRHALELSRKHLGPNHPSTKEVAAIMSRLSIGPSQH